MSVELLSLTAALTFGIARVFAKKGLETVSPITAATVSIGMSALVLFVGILASVPLARLASPGILYFILAGLFAPGLSRWLGFHSFQRLGVSLSVMMMAASPMWAGLIAIALLGEHITLRIALGTLTIIGGTAVLSGLVGPRPGWRRAYLLLPIAAGLVIGLRDVAVRQGLLIDDAPLIGAFISALVSLIMMSIFSFIGGGESIRQASKTGLGYCLIAGAIAGVSHITMFGAFAIGEVVLVSPLVSTHPVFAVILARYMFGASERLNARSLLGGACILAGAIGISLR